MKQVVDVFFHRGRVRDPNPKWLISSPTGDERHVRSLAGTRMTGVLGANFVVLVRVDAIMIVGQRCLYSAITTSWFGGGFLGFDRLYTPLHSLVPGVLSLYIFIGVQFVRDGTEVSWGIRRSEAALKGL